MKKILILIFSLFATIANAQTTIQQQLDAAEAAGGGVVQLGCGIFTNNNVPLRIASFVTLRGSGICTVLPTIYSKYTGVRTYYIGLENFQIDPNLVSSGYTTGINFSNVSQGIIRNVAFGCGNANSISTGLQFAYASYYNLVENFYACASVDGIEFYSNANSNTIIGGKLTAPIGAYVISSNGNTFVGVAMEREAPMEFIKLLNAAGTTAVNVRGEYTGYGPVFLNGKDGNW